MRTRGNSGGGGPEIKTGSYTVNTSALSFDCGIDSPDLFYMIEVRGAPIDNDWFLLYQKAGAFDNLLPALNNTFLQTDSRFEPVNIMANYKLSVSGSTVTFPNNANFNSTTWKWVAIKF